MPSRNGFMASDALILAKTHDNILIDEYDKAKPGTTGKTAECRSIGAALFVVTKIGWHSSIQNDNDIDKNLTGYKTGCFSFNSHIFSAIDIKALGHIYKRLPNRQFPYNLLLFPHSDLIRPIIDSI